jgi:hypothetical protein
MDSQELIISLRRHLDHHFDAVVYSHHQIGCSLAVMVGRLAAAFRNLNYVGPRLLEAFGARRSRSPLARLPHHTISISVIINGKRPIVPRI